MQADAVYGPYKHRNRWRVELVSTEGGKRTKTRKTFETEREALRFKQKIERGIARAQDADALRAKAEELRRLADEYSAKAEARDGRTMAIGDALERYERYMLVDKGNGEGSVTTTITRLSRFLQVHEGMTLTSITEQRARELYDERRPHVAVDTHRNELGQVKTFFRWCIERGWIARSPFEAVRGIGKRKRGKEQLRVEETRKVVDLALVQARQTLAQCPRRIDRYRRESALGVLVALYLAFRSSEVTDIVRRDVDDRGRLLWVPDAKTENGRRTLTVPEVLVPLLWQRAQECGNRPDSRLFPHNRGWLLYNVKRLCRAAGVPEVTAHGARGIHATLATLTGATAHLVAQTLGHDPSAVVTERHYIAPGAKEEARRERVRRYLDDGRTLAQASTEPTGDLKGPEREPTSWAHGARQREDEGTGPTSTAGLESTTAATSCADRIDPTLVESPPESMLADLAQDDVDRSERRAAIGPDRDLATADPVQISPSGEIFSPGWDNVGRQRSGPFGAIRQPAPGNRIWGKIARRSFPQRVEPANDSIADWPEMLGIARDLESAKGGTRTPTGCPTRSLELIVA